jgi:hypothetical protein
MAEPWPLPTCGRGHKTGDIPIIRRTTEGKAEILQQVLSTLSCPLPVDAEGVKSFLPGFLTLRSRSSIHRQGLNQPLNVIALFAFLLLLNLIRLT